MDEEAAMTLTPVATRHYPAYPGLAYCGNGIATCTHLHSPSVGAHNGSYGMIILPRSLPAPRRAPLTHL